MEVEYLSEKEVARIGNWSTSKLRQDRHKGIGIPYRKVSRRILYRRDEVIAFIEGCKIETADSVS